jgi:hypothetical protein
MHRGTAVAQWLRRCATNRKVTRSIGTVIAAWLQTWDLIGPHANPQNATKFPKNLEYIYLFAVKMAYIQPQRKEESSKAFRKRVYHTLHARNRG